MKLGIIYILFLSFLLTSCGGQKRNILEVAPDSLSVADLFYRKAMLTSSLDSVEWYADLACRYLSSDDRKLILYYNIASRCLVLGDKESALSYYEKVGQGANEWLQGRICLAIPNVYADMGCYTQAIHSLDSIRACRKSRTLVPYYQLAKGNVFVAVGRTDSACHYYEIASHSLNRWVASTAAYRLRLLYASQGKDSLACRWALSADAALQNEIDKEGFATDREKYEKEKMQNELNQLKISEQKREILTLSLGLCLVLVFFGFYLLWQHRKRKITRLLLQEKTVCLEQAQKLLEQAGELALLREKESQLRESLFRRMKSFHKIPSLEYQDENVEEMEESGKRIALSPEEWEDIRQTVDKSYDDFTIRLQKSFPSLTEKDMNFCCLVKIGVSIKDLSDIYCISRPSVSRKKQRVKREKLGLTAEDETLDAFLQRF